MGGPVRFTERRAAVDKSYPVLVAGLAAGPVADAVRRFAELAGCRL